MHNIETIQRAIDFVEDHLDEQLSLEQIAKAAAMSVPNLYRIFYAMTGHPMKEYIRKRRTSEAACLLRQSNLSTKEIGFRCGFDTYQTFMKTFKRNTGLTPGLYRKAGIIYNFERIRLYERETYMEEREVTERYPDVKVIRLAPLEGIGYLHVADREEGMEEAAMMYFRSLLIESQIDLNQMRLFGWNVDLVGSPPSFGYQLAAVGEKALAHTTHTELRPITLPGGTYAITWASMGSGAMIVNAWNRILSEWLPRSIFEIGDHGFLEEYQQFNGCLARLKLYFPVKRSQEKGSIEILERKPLKAMSFRAEGVNCASRADELAIDWLTRNDLLGDNHHQVYMRCNDYGNPFDESNMYEISIAIPEGFSPSQGEEHRVTYVKGGLYACLTTRAYGSMTGVLERIYRWLGSSDEYEADEVRSWFAHYVPDDSENEWAAGTFEKLVRVICCVPVVLRNQLQEGGS